MSLIKKVNLTIFMAAVFLVTVFITTQSTAAAEGLRLSVDRQTGSVGGQAIVKIAAENATGSEGGQFSLSFNSDLVRPVLAEAGELVTEADSSLSMANLEYAPGQLMFMWVTAYADTADSGTVCTIMFELLIEGETLLELDNIVVAPDGIEVGRTASGKITIGDTGEVMGVDQGENDHNDLDQEEEAEDVRNGNQERVNGEDNSEDNGEDSLTETAGAVSNTLLYIGLIVIAAAAAGGFVIFKRRKKPGV